MKGNKLLITGALGLALILPKQAIADDTNEDETELSLQQIVDLPDAPKTVSGTTSKKDEPVFLTEPDIIANYNEDTKSWESITSPLYNSTGITILRKNCENLNLKEGSTIILNNLGELAAYEPGVVGGELYLTKDLGTTTPGYFADIASTGKKNCKINGITENGIVENIIPGLDGSVDLSGLLETGKTVIGFEQHKKRKGTIMNNSGEIMAYRIDKDGIKYDIEATMTITPTTSVLCGQNIEGTDIYCPTEESCNINPLTNYVIGCNN